MPGIWATTAAGQQKQRHSPQDNTKPHHTPPDRRVLREESAEQGSRCGAPSDSRPAHETEQDDSGRWSVKKNAITRRMCEEKAQIKLNVW